MKRGKNETEQQNTAESDLETKSEEKSQENNGGEKTPKKLDEVGIEKVVQEVCNDAPVADDGLIVQEGEGNNTANTVEKIGGPVDKYDRSFNPDFHAINPDGSPKLTKKGALKIKPGRSNSIIGERGVKSQGPLIPDVKKYEGTAKLTADTLEQISVVFGGEKFRMKNEEKISVAGAFENYYAAKDISDIPPGVALTLVLGGYYMSRIDFDSLKKKNRGFLAKMKAKIFGRKEGENAQPDSGDNGVREIDASEKA